LTNKDVYMVVKEYKRNYYRKKDNFSDLTLLLFLRIASIRKLLEIDALSVTHKILERIVPSNFFIAFDIRVPRTRSACVRVECLAGTPRVPVK